MFRSEDFCSMWEGFRNRVVLLWEAYPYQQQLSRLAAWKKGAHCVPLFWELSHCTVQSAIAMDTVWAPVTEMERYEFQFSTCSVHGLTIPHFVTGHLLQAGWKPLWLLCSLHYIQCPWPCTVFCLCIKNQAFLRGKSGERLLLDLHMDCLELRLDCWELEVDLVYWTSQNKCSSALSPGAGVESYL